MLTKKTPETIKGDLTIKAQGVENNLLLTYHNRTPDEYEAFVKNPENMKFPEALRQDDAVAHVNTTLALFLVKSFDDGTDKEFPLTREGLMDLERYWPGTLYGIIRGYHKSRTAEVEKN